MSIANATEQALDAIAEKHGARWSEDYRRRFAAMVAKVKAYRAGSEPRIAEQRNNQGGPDEHTR